MAVDNHLKRAFSTRFLNFDLDLPNTAIELNLKDCDEDVKKYEMIFKYNKVFYRCEIKESLNRVSGEWWYDSREYTECELVEKKMVSTEQWVTVSSAKTTIQSESEVYQVPIVKFENDDSQKQEPLFLGITLKPKKINLETKLYEENFREVTSEDIKQIEMRIQKK